MAWPTPIPSNATTGVSTAINDTIAAVQSWKGIVNANNNNLANVGIAQVGSLYVGGQPFNGYNTTEVVAVATGNPQVWNFTAKNFNGKPVVYFDGAKQPTANYSIAGTVAPLAFLNSGFESGLTSWGVGTTTGISTVNPHGGTKSAFISTASGSLSQTVSGLTSGTSYTITVQMRGDAGTSASAFLRASNGSGGAATTGSTVAATTSWQTLTVVYTADSTVP